MKETNHITAPCAYAASHGLLELDRRVQIRQTLRSAGFSLKAHDEITRELREQAAQDCLDASKEARDNGDHEAAVTWARAYARQEWYSKERN
tara:strand:+ start:37139 stop:37414 length:276 start_codon:yes stop_codon:yes gene_type:complete